MSRIRNFRGIHSVVVHAPWRIDVDFLRAYGIWRVAAGRRCSADPKDPYWVPEMVCKFLFIEDPYNYMFSHMTKIIMSNVDASNDPNGFAFGSPTHGTRGSK